MNKKQVLLVWIIMALVMVTFCNALSGRFAGDDNLLIVKNTFYRSLKNIPRLFQKDYNYRFDKGFDGQMDDYGPGSVAYRPVDNLTYFMDYQLWGLKPFGYHLTNVLIHMANVVLVYCVLMGLSVPSILAFFASLLFGLHPIQSEAVCMIGYRADLLACMFTLLAFLAWARFSDNKEHKVFYFLSLLTYILAIFSKESAIVFPLVVLFYEWSFKKHSRPCLEQAGFWIITGFYIYAYFILFPNSALKQHSLFDGLSTVSYCAVLGKIWEQYITAFLVPSQVNLIPSLYIPEVKGIWWELFWPVILLFLVIYPVFKVKDRAFLFLWAWFFIFYFPVANLVPIANPMAYRFMYLPSIGFLAGAALLFDRFCSWKALTNASKRIGVILKASIVLFLVTLCIMTNALWNNNYLIALKWVEDYPRSWMGYEVLGLYSYDQGKYREAKELFLKCIQRGGRPHLSSIDYYLGICYLNEKDLDAALKHFQIALRSMDNDPQVLSVIKKIDELQKN